MRTTLKHVEGAFKRLHRAMEWPVLVGTDVEPLPHYTKDDAGFYKANIGAAALSETGYGFNIEIIVNDGGGVTTPFTGWSTKREAFDTMAAMAAAVAMYKREN